MHALQQWVDMYIAAYSNIDLGWLYPLYSMTKKYDINI